MPKRNRIQAHTAALLIATAIFFDGLQALFGIFNVIPIVGTIAAALFGWMVSTVAFLTFFLWFKLLGVDFLDRGVQKAAALLGGFLMETIPILNLLPGWTLSVVLLIFFVRHADAVYNKEQRRDGAATT